MQSLATLVQNAPSSRGRKTGLALAIITGLVYYAPGAYSQALPTTEYGGVEIIGRQPDDTSQTIVIFTFSADHAASTWTQDVMLPAHAVTSEVMCPAISEAWTMHNCQLVFANSPNQLPVGIQAIVNDRAYTDLGQFPLAMIAENWDACMQAGGVYGNCSSEYNGDALRLCRNYAYSMRLAALEGGAGTYASTSAYNLALADCQSVTGYDSLNWPVGILGVILGEEGRSRAYVRSHERSCRAVQQMSNDFNCAVGN